jgi:3-oxoacyl-[acyl-carrier protein] reductase
MEAKMKKYAFITGASGGIGSAIAKKIGEMGYCLYLHYYQNEEKIKILQAELKKDGIESFLIQGDLANQKETNRFIEQVNQPLDVLIYTAGKNLYGLVTDFTDEEIHQMIYLHVTQLYKITNVFLPKMIQKKAGNVIVISSIWGSVGASCEVLYSMVKGAQNTYVKALAKELAPSNIRVNGVAPGAIDTNMLDNFSIEDKNLLKEEIPMGRMGKSTEIANVVKFLVSEESSYITGQIIGVNGGWYS